MTQFLPKSMRQARPPEDGASRSSADLRPAYWGLDSEKSSDEKVPVKIKHQIAANTVVVLDNGDVIVGQAIASDVNLQVGMKDENGQQAYEVVWRLKIGRPV